MKQKTTIYLKAQDLLKVLKEFHEQKDPNNIDDRQKLFTHLDSLEEENLIAPLRRKAQEGDYVLRDPISGSLPALFVPPGGVNISFLSRDFGIHCQNLYPQYHPKSRVQLLQVIKD